MIKLTFCLRRKPDMTRQEFLSYWSDNHAPLVRKMLEPLGLRRYVLSKTVESPLNDLLAASRGTPAAFDGVAELWFDSLEGIAEAMSTPEGMEASALLLEDEGRFIDFDTSPLFLTEEDVIVGS